MFFFVKKNIGILLQIQENRLIFVVVKRLQNMSLSISCITASFYLNTRLLLPDGQQYSGGLVQKIEYLHKNREGESVYIIHVCVPFWDEADIEAEIAEIAAGWEAHQLSFADMYEESSTN